jgi:hypothetical protein
MSDIFVSYSSADRERAKSLAVAFAAQGWSVFWDQIISARESFPDVLERELDNTQCVVVLWSQASVKSRWVKEEAFAAAERNILFPALIDDVELPFGFKSIQTIRLVEWQGELAHPEFSRLLRDLAKVIGHRKPRVSIAKPEPSGPVTDEHLVLVHSSWRVPQRDAEFGGQEMYQIHVIVFGDHSALDRIQKVAYYLDPAYPDPVRESTDRQRNFELKELANGYSVVRADISIQGQVELVRLSRFINLTETGPRLEAEFMR